MTNGSDAGATRLDGAIIARSLRCAQCGYDLRGLEIGRRCPECGLETMQSVQRVVDPAARGLPQLTDPRGVGDALVWVMLCLVAATLLLLARPIALYLDALTPGAAGGFVASTPPSLMVGSAGALFLGLVSVVTLAPPRGRESGGAVSRDLWLLAGGLVAAAVTTIAMWLRGMAIGSAASVGRGADPHVLQRTLFIVLLLGSSVVILFALRGILRTIGERSREYRTARGGRQGIRAMIAAAVAIAVGAVLCAIGAAPGRRAWIAPGTVIMWVCTLMLVIGLLYLLVNAIWIRRSLRRPPPTWRDVLLLPRPEHRSDSPS